MLGECLDFARVSDIGIEGDRRFGIVDVASGRVLTAKREGRLLCASSRFVGNTVVITLPDGRETIDDADLSAWLDREVVLRAAGAEGGQFENPQDFEHEADWVQWQGPPHAWHDVNRARLSLVSTASIAPWDPARFRSNVLLDGSGEDDLVGRSVRVGTVHLSIEKHLTRCVVVTRAQGSLPRDLDVLRTINRERDGKLAVGALVTTAGRISLGDEVVTL